MIPVLVCIDVEPFERQVALRAESGWSGVLETAELFESFRERIRSATGRAARFAWFFRMDPQIEKVHGSAAWAAARYAELVRRWRQAGDAIGLHVHAWRWSAGPERWVKDHADRAWLARCLETGLASYFEAFGRPCPVFRFGDAYLDDDLVKRLSRSGVAADLTLEPGFPARPASGVAGELGTGSFPDTRGCPVARYRPRARDFRRPSRLPRRRTWLVPVSTGKLPGHAPAVTLNLAFYSPSMRWLFDDLLGRRDRRHVALVARTDIGAREDFRSAATETLDHIARHPLLPRLTFVTPEEMIEKNLDRAGRSEDAGPGFRRFLILDRR